MAAYNNHNSMGLRLQGHGQFLGTSELKFGFINIQVHNSM